MDSAANESNFSEIFQAIPHFADNISAGKNIPTKFELSPNSPNPFNPTTTISYALPKDSYVQLSIFSLNGQLVEKLVDGRQAPGYYTAQWNAARFSSGVYLYKLIAGDYIKIRKCILIK